MTKICYKCRGAISVLLVLIMLPMFVCAGLCVDGSRVTIAKSTVSGAGDLAMNAALAQYDTDLHDIYGVFAVSKSMDDLKNNVQRYFENTVNNSNVLEGTDSYTRNFIDNLVNSMFSGEEVDFNNIIDTQVEDNSFNITSVNESSIARPENFKKQIVEYMKYRGPVNMARGLLTKLGCIGDTAKQSKALKAKLSYEEDLEDVGDECENAYNAIKAYNDVLSGSILSGSNIAARFQDSVRNARNYFTEMTQYIIAVNSSETKQIQVKNDESYKSIINSYFNNETTNKQKLEIIEKELLDKDYINFQNNSGKLYNKINSLKSSALNDFKTQAEYVLDIHKLESDFNNLYTLANLYDEYYEKYKLEEEFKTLPEEEKNTYKDKNDTLKDLKVDMPQMAETMKNIVNNWKDYNVWESGEKGRQELSKWLEDIDLSIEKLDKAISKMDAVIKSVKSLDGSRNEWNSRINDLQPGTVRTTMQGDYESSAKDINEDAVNDLKDTLENNKNYFTGLKEAILQNTYYDKIIATELSSGDYYNQYSSHIGNGNENSYEAIAEKADICILNDYNVCNYNASDDGIGQINSGEFFLYLERVYGGWEDPSNDLKKSEAKEKRKELIKAGNQGTDKTIDTSGVANGSIEGSIDSSVKSDMDNVLSGTGTGEAEASQEGIAENTDNNKTMSNNCKNNLSNVASIFSNIVNILESGRDNLYIEEYVTEMLSCYTSPYSSSGENIAEPVVSTLNKSNELSSHKFYRSEIEYVLFHKDTAEENLQAAKGMIFAIRFALNSVYAFSASDIRAYTSTIATAIAGWTGFGVPIVQSVLTFALAMGESLIDVNSLCQGKDVALYKTPNTWSLSVDGLKNTISTEIQNKVLNSVSVGITNVFTKINDTASDAIDTISSTVTEYTNNTTESVVESIQSSVINPLQTCILNLIGASYDLTDEIIRNNIEEVLNTVKSYGTDTGIMGEATDVAIDIVRTQCEDSLVNMVKEQFNEFKTRGQSAVEEITNTVNDTLKQVANIIKQKTATVVEKVNKELKQGVDEVLSDTSDKAKAIAKEKITQLIDNYNCSLSGVQAIQDDTRIDTSKDRTGMSGGLTMSYKEYLKVFCLLGCMNNSDGVLSRTLQLLQLNISSDNSSFNIAKAYTMLQVSATVSIRTSFLDVVTTNGNGIELDYSNLGTGRQKIKYLGINGY